MDPSVGYKKMSLNNFNKIFTGHIIMMHPRNEIIKMDTITNAIYFFISYFFCFNNSFAFKKCSSFFLASPNPLYASPN